MNAENVKKFKSLIDSSIEELSARFVDFEIDSYGDECDGTQANAILEVAYAEKDRNTLKLNNLTEARIKIGNGDYGECEECGEDIGIKRLMIFPDAKYCIVCAEKIEKKAGKGR